MRVCQWKLSHRGDLALEVLVQWLQPIVRGWVNYYGRFCSSHLYRALHMVDEAVGSLGATKIQGLQEAFSGRMGLAGTI